MFQFWPLSFFVFRVLSEDILRLGGSVGQVQSSSPEERHTLGVRNDAQAGGQHRRGEWRNAIPDLGFSQWALPSSEQGGPWRTRNTIGSLVLGSFSH